MKNNIRAIEIALVFFYTTCCCYGQVHLTGEQFAALPYADAEQAIKKPYLGGTYSSYASAALNSGRIDLISLCFIRAGLCMALYEQTSKLPESPLREEVLIMMLKTPSPFWPSDNYASSDEPRRIEDGWSAPFLSLTTKYLPQVVLTSEDLLAGSAARADIASKIEHAAKISVELPTQVSPAPNEGLMRKAAPHPLPASSATSSPPDIVTVSKTEGLLHHPIWITGGVLALLTLAWAALKKRR